MMLRSMLVYGLAALAEIGGCFAVWAVLRNGASAAWLAGGAMALGAFAWLLAQSDQAFAGRAFAAYGGVYVAASLVWLWAVEGEMPKPSDVLGAALVLAGAGVIVMGARA